jgi:hypothetical protein
MDRESSSGENRSLLRVIAKIISEGDDFIIEIRNSERDETVRVDSVKDYAKYLIESVNTSKCDDFKVEWLPSPEAKREHIDLIGMQLGMMHQFMENELSFQEGRE